MEFLLQAWKVKPSDHDKAAWYFVENSGFYRADGQWQKATVDSLTNTATLHQLPWIRIVFSGNKYVQTGNDEFLDPCKAALKRKSKSQQNKY